MTMNRRTLLQRSALGALASSFGLPALAQTGGNASIISGFPAGGMGDFVSRPLAEKLRGKYAPNVLVESKVGAGGRIAVDYVRRAATDGLTILQIPSSPMVLYPHIYKKLSYNPVSDFIPVCPTVNYELSITAGPGLPAEVKTLADFLKWAKANPRQASYGVPAAGSAGHFVGMMLARLSGVELSSVAYRGGAPLLQDVLGGQIPISVNVIGEVAPHIRAGKLRSLAVTGPERSPFLPGVPNLIEQGYKDIVVREWLGWFVPARTPMDTVNKLAALVRAGLKEPEFVEALAKNSLQPLILTPEEFASQMRADLERWGAIAKATGFTAEE